MCETSLNKATKIPENIFKGYNSFSQDHPSGEKMGVLVYFMESLPLRLRHDLAFDECIVAELNFGWKKLFFTVLYSNPIRKSDSPEFLNFIQKVEDLHRNMANEKSLLVV